MSTETLELSSIKNSFLLSLEDLSMLSAVKALMLQDDIKKKFLVDSQSWCSDSAQKISNISKACRSKIDIPEIFESKLLPALNWISLQCRKWIDFFEYREHVTQKFANKMDLYNHLMESIIWDINGTINYERSTHKLFSSVDFVKDDEDLLFMFKNASEGCLENDIKELWSTLSASTKKDILDPEKKEFYASYFYTYYWACTLSGEMEKFLKYAAQYPLKRYKSFGHGFGMSTYAAEEIGNNSINLGFFISVFDGTLDAVKYFFSKEPSVDVELVTDLYLSHYDQKYGGGHRGNPKDVKILFYLLGILENDVAERVINRHFEVIFKASANYWPWQKFLVTTVKMYPGVIDQVLLFDILTKLLREVNWSRTDFFLLKNLWKSLTKDVKKSFCSYVSVSQKDRNCDDFWRWILDKEVIDLFLRENDLREILTPYGNYGVDSLIHAREEYNIINYWLKTCLISEEAIISFMEDYAVKKSIRMTKYINLSHVVTFLSWAYKHEDVMDKKKILKVKDDLIKEIGVKKLLNGIKLGKWGNLKKFIDWMLRNRDDYDSKLIKLKEETLKLLFKQTGEKCWKQKNFAKNLKEFINYGIKDTKKVKLIMSNVKLQEGESCWKWLKKESWKSIDAFLEFVADFGGDFLKVKKNIFHYIFKKDEDNVCLSKETFCENFKKLINWSYEEDTLSDVKKKIDDIKRTIINKYSLDIIMKCIRENCSDGLKNILDCLFKDEDLNMRFKDAKTVLELKKRAIEKSLKEDNIWKKENWLFLLLTLINYGKEDEKIEKEIWAAKKFFIEHIKKNVKAERIVNLILVENKDFLHVLFDGDKDKIDFDKTLWDLKEFLIKKLATDENHLLFCQLFEKMKRFDKFLNWNGFSKEGMKELKKFILDGKLIQECCLHWIVNDKFYELKMFLDWCVLKETKAESKLVKLKQDVTEYFFCEYSDKWEEKYFQLLNRFLFLNYSESQKGLKKDLIDKYGIKGCIKKLCNKDYDSVVNFMNWAIKGNKETSVYDFKENLLKEILSGDDIYYWKENICLDDMKSCINVSLDKFLYEYDNPDVNKISNMKFNLIEEYFSNIFRKMLSKEESDIKNFVKWIFDEHINSEDFTPKSKNFRKELFDKFGKEYCVLMLNRYDWEAATEFWSLCHSTKLELKLKEAKSLLWDFKKECVKEIVTNYVNDTDRWFAGSSLWIRINKFLTWKHTSSKMKDEINEFKNMIRKEYGIEMMKSILKTSKNFYDEPKCFLKWIFGISKPSNNVDENVLIDFKKEVLENVFTAEFEDAMKTEAFYEILDKILRFYSPNLVLKSSFINVQGVKLCVDLISRNNLTSLAGFLKWVIANGNIFDFKRAVAKGLAENLTMSYTWESFKYFLDYGFDVNNEQDKVKILQLKNFVSESLGVDICYHWVLHNQWDEIRIFLEWSFEPLSNQKLIEFKNCLIEKHGSTYCNARIFDDDWKKLEKFLVWSFESYKKGNEREEKIVNLKIKTLEKEINYKDHLNVLLRYLEWGFESKKSLNKFKKNILQKTHPLNYFVVRQKYKSQKAFKLWFANSK